MNINEINKIFGQAGEIYIPLINEIKKKNSHFAYQFLYNDEFQEIMGKDINLGQKKYWEEILEYAHIASFNSIVRHLKWIEGMTTAYQIENFILFASSWRGLLESISDSFYSLRAIPLSIAENYHIICKILNDDKSIGKKVITAKEVEEILIHYVFGKRIKKGDDFPKYHNALNVRDYLDKMFVDNKLKISECYATLCQITHPAHLSVLNFYDYKSANDGYIMTYTPNNQKNKINELIDDFSLIFQDLFMNGFNAQIITLKLLNKFDISKLKTNYVDSINYSNVKLWQKIEKLIK